MTGATVTRDDMSYYIGAVFDVIGERDDGSAVNVGPEFFVRGTFREHLEKEMVWFAGRAIKINDDGTGWGMVRLASWILEQVRL